MSATNVLLVLCIVSPLIGAAANLKVPASRPGLMRRVTLVAFGACLALAFVLSACLVSGGAVEFWVGGVAFGLDAFSIGFFVTDALLGLVFAVFSRVIEHPRGYFWTVGFAQASILAAISTRSLLVFWAGCGIVAICICLLMSFWGLQRDRHANIHMVLPVALFLVAMGLAFVIAASGIYSSDAGSTMLQVVVYGLLLAAFGAIMGLFPLHSWLARVHEQIPVGLGMLLDGGFFSLAAYGLIRIAPYLAPLGWEVFGQPLALLSTITVVYGAAALIAQYDLRRVTAYCTISYTGVICLALASGTGAGVVAAVVLSLGRMVASGLLIIICQMILTRTQTLDARELPGLASSFPLIAGFLVLAVSGLCGAPLTSAFVGILLVQAVVWGSGLPAAFAVAVVAGFVVLAVGLIRIVALVCTGEPSEFVSAYVRHLGKAPFETFALGRHVSVQVEPKQKMREPEHPVFAGDLAGLADFEIKETSTVSKFIPFESLRASASPAAAAAPTALARSVGSRDALDPSIVDELAGAADIKVAHPAAEPVGETAAVSSDGIDEGDRHTRTGMLAEDLLNDTSPCNGEQRGYGNDKLPMAEFEIGRVKPFDEEVQARDAPARKAAECKMKKPVWQEEMPKLATLASGDLLVLDVQPRGHSVHPLLAWASPAGQPSGLSAVSDGVLSGVAGLDSEASRRQGKVIVLRMPAHEKDAEDIDHMLDSIVEQDARTQKARSDIAAVIEEEQAVEKSRVRRIPAGSAAGFVKTAPLVRSEAVVRKPKRPLGTPLCSPEDSEAHETLPDYSSDTGCTSSTLTWSELASALLLLAAMFAGGCGVGMFTSLLSTAAAPLLTGGVF